MLSERDSSDRRSEEILEHTIDIMVKSKSKGMFLLDDHVPAIALRLAQFQLTNDLFSRKQFYDIFIHNINYDYICAVSVSQDVLECYNLEGVNCVDKLFGNPVLIGLRMDMGIAPLNYIEANKKECLTEGLQYIANKLEQYKDKGLSFTRWRSVFTVSANSTPTYFSLTENTKAIAQFAKMSQSFAKVPMAEIELLKMGEYTIELGSRALERILVELSKVLIFEDVYIGGVVLVIGMVSGGEGNEESYSNEEIAQATLNALEAALPAGLGGVAISSGGLSEEHATRVLECMMARADKLPWPVTFAFGRALQHSAYTSWGGDDGNTDSAREVFERRQEANTMAIKGTYEPTSEQNSASNEYLYTEEYIY